MSRRTGLSNRLIRFDEGFWSRRTGLRLVLIVGICGQNGSQNGNSNSRSQNGNSNSSKGSSQKTHWMPEESSSERGGSLFDAARESKIRLGLDLRAQQAEAEHARNGRLCLSLGDSPSQERGASRDLGVLQKKQVSVTSESHSRIMHVSKKSIFGNATFVEKRHLQKHFSPASRFLHLLDRPFLTALPARGASGSSGSSGDPFPATGRPCQGPGGAHLRCITRKQSQHAPPAQFSPALTRLEKTSWTGWKAFWKPRIAHCTKPSL